MNFITFTIKDLLTKKFRLCVAVVGISLGICACIIMLGIADTLKSSFSDLYKRRKTDIIVVERDQLSILASELEQSLIDDLKVFDEVEDVAPALISFTKLKRTYIPIFGWEQASFLFENIQMKNGRVFDADSSEILIGDLIADNIDSTVGATLKIKRSAFSIAGTFTSSNSFERGSILMPLSSLQKLKKKTGKITLINLRLRQEYRNDDAMDAFIEKVGATFPQVSAQKADFFIAENTKHVMMGEKLSLLITIIMTIAITFGVSNIMLTIFFEKTRFLSLLLTVGWQKWEVAFFFFVESLLIVFLGGVLGTGAGINLMARVFQLTDISILTPSLPSFFYLKVIGLICGIAFVAIIGPTIILLNFSPVDVLKNE